MRSERGLYAGLFRGNAFNGLGAWIGNSGDRYFGNFLSGVPSGHGTAFFSDGSCYTGNFVNGRSNGQGQFHFSDGSYYVGNFVGGHYSGQGTFRSGAGYYSGEFMESLMRNPSAIVSSEPSAFQCSSLQLSDGSYVGYVHSGRPAGYGRLTYTSGTVYEGYFAEGQPSISGTYTEPAGRVFRGSFFNAVLEGYGSITDPHSDNTYVGFVHQWLPQGIGMTTHERNIFIGEFDRGIASASGVFLLNDGSVLWGSFSENVMSRGDRITGTGELHTGTFSHNVLTQGTIRRLDGTVTSITAPATPAPTAAPAPLT
jgi:hypothetical protein